MARRRASTSTGDTGRLAYDPFKHCSIARALDVAENVSRRIVKAAPATGYGGRKHVEVEVGHLKHLARVCREALADDDAPTAAAYAFRLGCLLEHLHGLRLVPQAIYAHQQREARRAGGRKRAARCAATAASVCRLVDDYFAEHGRRGQTQAAYAHVRGVMRLSTDHVKKTYLKAKAAQPTP